MKKLLSSGNKFKIVNSAIGQYSIKQSKQHNNFDISLIIDTRVVDHVTHAKDFLQVFYKIKP